MPMPPTHKRTFRVRHYECDAHGHVNHANYLRYMQEAAFDASAAVGYDLDRYQALGRFWLVRETDITYLRPLTYGQSVIVKTWVLDFRRVRSRRAYELRLAGTDEPVASAVTDWVFLDRESQRPVSVPEEMVQAFLPAGAAGPGTAGNGPAREPFPTLAPRPPGAFTMRRQVRWRDIDGAGHVNNATYMTYVEDCSVAVAAAFGWPMRRILDAGFAIIARRSRIEYRQPALLDEELEIETWISDVGRATAVRNYTITRAADGALLARAHVQWVWVDLATGRPIRIPAGLMDDFAANVSR